MFDQLRDDLEKARNNLDQNSIFRAWHAALMTDEIFEKIRLCCPPKLYDRMIRTLKSQDPKGLIFLFDNKCWPRGTLFSRDGSIDLKHLLHPNIWYPIDNS